MRTFDPTPLRRSTIGFDRLFDLLNASTRIQLGRLRPSAQFVVCEWASENQIGA